MKRYVYGLTIAIVSTLFLEPAIANEDIEKRKLVEQIMERVKARVLVEQQMEAVIASLQSQAPIVVAEAGVAPAQRDLASRILAAELGTMKSKMSMAAMEITVHAYSAAFTLQELRDLLAFYLTPTGIKVTTDLPRLQAEGIQRGRQQGEKIAQESFCSAFAKFKQQNISATPLPFCR